MFNVAIIKLKDIIKYLITIIVIIIAIYVLKRYFFNSQKFDFTNLNIVEKISGIIENSIKNAIEEELPIINQVFTQEEQTEEELIDENEDNADEEFLTEVFTSMLATELEVINSDMDINNEEEDSEEEITDAEKEEDNDETTKESEELKLATLNESTEIVTENPLSDSSTDEYNGVKIKNETDYELTDDTLNANDLNIDSSNIIIFHTHTCESYTSSELYSYTPTGNYRTTDLNYSVAKVGDELETYLTEYGFNVVHNKTYHDYPAYSGSYTRSLETVSSLLENTDADIVIDLHRDAIGSYSTYAPTVKIGDDYCAQIMFVIGSNGGGLYHPNWKSNLKFAVKIQEIANSIYPGLFKSIILRNSRYNQHLASAACIIEVGATGNTLEQCLNSMKYLAAIFNMAFN